MPASQSLIFDRATPDRRAGETITVPVAIADLAEPYTLGTMPSVRSKKIIITSGATRTTLVTSRKLDTQAMGINPLEWVVFDAANNAWVVQGPTALADYQGGLKSADLTPDASKRLGQLYKAVRLTGSDLAEASQFVNIPEAVTSGTFSTFAGAPGVVEAKCCVKVGGEQLVNVPPLDSDSPVRIDGLRAISGEGVFVLPSDAEFVRLNGMSSGRRSDVRELAGAELEITFAHESNSGVFTDDYFVVGFEWTQDIGGFVTINTMMPAEVDLALADPDVVKVGVPFLRRVMTLGDGETVPLSFNSTELIAIAKQIAVARLSSGSVQAGTIELRGIVDVNPGDIDGSVTAVSFDHERHVTRLTINEHEVPRSFYERARRIAGESVASGIGAMRLRRSSASLSDARSTLVADDSAKIEGAAMPENNPAMRGRTRAIAGTRGIEAAGVKARRELPTIVEQSMIFARITGSTALAARRWTYQWEEARFASDLAVGTGAARTSVTHGDAINTMEMPNGAVGMQGNGVNADNLVGSFDLQPIAVGAVVVIMGPFSDNQPRWYFATPNAVDGACP